MRRLLSSCIYVRFCNQKLKRSAIEAVWAETIFNQICNASRSSMREKILVDHLRDYKLPQISYDTLSKLVQKPGEIQEVGNQMLKLFDPYQGVALPSVILNSQARIQDSLNKKKLVTFYPNTFITPTIFTQLKLMSTVQRKKMIVGKQGISKSVSFVLAWYLSSKATHFRFHNRQEVQKLFDNKLLSCNFVKIIYVSFTSEKKLLSQIIKILKPQCPEVSQLFQVSLESNDTSDKDYQKKIDKVLQNVKAAYQQKGIKCVVVFDQVNRLASVFHEYNQLKLNPAKVRDESEPKLDPQSILSYNKFFNLLKKNFLVIYNSSANIERQLLGKPDQATPLTLDLNQHSKIQQIQCKYNTYMDDEDHFQNRREICRFFWYESTKYLDQQDGGFLRKYFKDYCDQLAKNHKKTWSLMTPLTIRQSVPGVSDLLSAILEEKKQLQRKFKQFIEKQLKWPNSPEEKQNFQEKVNSFVQQVFGFEDTSQKRQILLQKILATTNAAQITKARLKTIKGSRQFDVMLNFLTNLIESELKFTTYSVSKEAANLKANNLLKLILQVPTIPKKGKKTEQKDEKLKLRQQKIQEIVKSFLKNELKLNFYSEFLADMKPKVMQFLQEKFNPQSAQFKKESSEIKIKTFIQSELELKNLPKLEQIIRQKVATYLQSVEKSIEINGYRMAKQKASDYLKKQKNQAIFRKKHNISKDCAIYIERNQDKIITSIPFSSIKVDRGDIQQYYNKDFFYFNSQNGCLDVKVSKPELKIISQIFITYGYPTIQDILKSPTSTGILLERYALGWMEQNKNFDFYLQGEQFKVSGFQEFIHFYSDNQKQNPKENLKMVFQALKNIPNNIFCFAKPVPNKQLVLNEISEYYSPNNPTIDLIGIRRNNRGLYEVVSFDFTINSTKADVQKKQQLAEGLIAKLTANHLSSQKNPKKQIDKQEKPIKIYLWRHIIACRKQFVGKISGSRFDFGSTKFRTEFRDISSINLITQKQESAESANDRGCLKQLLKKLPK